MHAQLVGAARAFALSVALVVPLVVTGAVTAPPALAYTFTGCRWTLNELGSIRYNEPTVYGTAVTEAAGSWNTDAAWFGVEFNKATTNLDIGVVVTNYGYTEWFGQVEDYCPGGIFQGYQVLKLNRYWLNRYNKPVRRAVAAHEFGHLLGLGHSNIGSACSAYPLMHANVNHAVSCQNSHPRLDDLNGILARYY